MKMSTKKFIKKAKEIHNGGYDYSETDIKRKDSKGKIKIICLKHGEFWIKPSNFLHGSNCPKCAHRSYKYTKEEFIEKITEIHGDKYDLSTINYIDSHTPIYPYCRKHNIYFKILPTNFLKGEKCKFCSQEEQSSKKKSNTNDFIKKAKKIHGNNYNYSKVNYVKSNINVIVTCSKHGDFSITPNNHLAKKGCPKCQSSHLENEIRNILKESNISFKEQYKDKWLGLQSLDFFLPEYNIAIECQGEQHFKPFRFEKNNEGLNKRIMLDERKRLKCNQNKIKLIYFADKPYNNDIITDKSVLIKTIKGEAN